MKNKKIFVIILSLGIICIIVGIILLLHTNESQEDTTEDTIFTDTTYKDLSISNISFEYDGAQTILTATVTNETEADINVDSIEVVLKDKNGDEIETLELFLGTTIAPSGSINASSAVMGDITSDVADVEYK